MRQCRVFPSTVQGWRSILDTALNTPNNQLRSPPHFQAYCIDPATKRVKSELNYSSMLGTAVKSVKRRSGVLCLLEPVMLSSCNLLDKDKNTDANDNPIPKSSNKKNDSSNGNATTDLTSHLHSELRTYITLRQGFMRTHKGEISFPGGKVDEGETLEQAAVREGIEEVGAQPDKYDVVGTMSRVYSFPSRTFVTPVVGLAKDGASSPCIRHLNVRGGRSSASDTAGEKPNGIEFDKSIKNWTPATVGETNPILVPFNDKATTLGLKVTSECEVDSIETIDLCQLLLSTEHHHYVERTWKSPELGNIEMQWMLPAFFTAENQQTLWGLTGFVFCELLCRIAHALQQQPLPVGATPFECEVYKQIQTFFSRSSHHYHEKCGQVTGLPAPSEEVRFVNPYDSIKD